MQSYDVAVVGLGAVGSATVYQLSKTGLSVVGIDKYSPPHAKGSSHGESRITRQALGEGAYYSPLALRANEIWKELEHKSGQELYNPCGLLMISNPGNDFFETTKQAAKDYGVGHEFLDNTAVTKRFPAIRMKSDEAAYFEPGGGFLRPEKCIEVQLQLAKDNGVELRPDTEVTSIREARDGAITEFSDGTRIKASKVILAQGPWVSEFLPLDLKPLFKTLYQTLYWFDIDQAEYEKLRPGKMPAIICDTQRLEGPEYYNFYGFPAIGNKTDGIKFAIHDIPPEADPDEKDLLEPVEGAADLLYKNVSKYVSGLKSGVLRSMNCIYTVTPDEDFVIDFAPGSEKIVVASPCSGHGFKHSAATGEILAELATKGTTTIDISKFSFKRF